MIIPQQRWVKVKPNLAGCGFGSSSLGLLGLSVMAFIYPSLKELFAGFHVSWAIPHFVEDLLYELS